MSSPHAATIPPTPRVFNFAYGAIVTTAVYVFYALHDQAGVNWPASAG